MFGLQIYLGSTEIPVETAEQLDSVIRLFQHLRQLSNTNALLANPPYVGHQPSSRPIARTPQSAPKAALVTNQAHNEPHFKEMVIRSWDKWKTNGGDPQEGITAQVWLPYMLREGYQPKQKPGSKPTKPVKLFTNSLGRSKIVTVVRQLPTGQNIYCLTSDLPPGSGLPK